MSSLPAFHPAVADWFAAAFPGGPTEAQRRAWPAIAAGRHTLVAAPTGSGKTLTAFLAAIDALVVEGLAAGELPERTTVVYVSPLKALSNDIRLNLETPLAGIRAALVARGLPALEIRAAVRTGDTPAGERAAMLRRPPQLLVTTPESLYVLLGSASGRGLLGEVRTVIVDEIHAVANGKRGSQLALTLERLDALVETRGGRPPVRIGLSATQKPVEAVARFLVGTGPSAATPDGGPIAAGPAAARDCTVVDIGYAKQRDLALVVPPTPLTAVMSNDQWEQVHDQIVERVAAHRTTLVFVNTRRLAERLARHLAERLGREAVAAHHGSLAKEIRLLAEQRLKRGELKVLVATASLELGLDIGDVDLVIQVGSPRSIATFLQRAGRSGHAVGGVPRARLFPQTRDELIECAALLDAVRRGELDALRIPRAPLDVLAQSLAAEVAARDAAVPEDTLFALARRAMPYAALARDDFDAVVRLLADGIASRERTRGSLLHRDAVHRLLRPRRGARMVAVTSGGTIPETGDYTVVLEPDATVIGTVNEDFAIESMAGDVFQLGNASYRIERVETGRVRVTDAKGAPPNIPFWLGEAPGRTDELSLAVSRLRETVAALLTAGETVDAPAGDEGGPLPGHRAAIGWLIGTVGLDEAAASQAVDYLASGLATLGAMPSRRCVVLERFFDESGSTQLVLHAPFGSRINRAWGLALRKRFCRQFNFELQAAATEDAILLSLSTSHSFPLAEVARYLHSRTAEAVLVQALLAAPMFPARWRWNLVNALVTPRMSGGRKAVPQLQRMRAEDLLAAVFPDQVACAENLAGEREVPDHPLVAQTLDDCLHDAMDSDGWLAVLRDLEAGRIRVHAAEPPAPSSFAAEILNARPYAFLDDAPLEERRARAVQARRYADPDSPDDLGRLDPEAIAMVRREAWPEPRDAEEMHEALADLGVLTDGEAARDPRWTPWLEALAGDGRAIRLQRPDPPDRSAPRDAPDASGAGADRSRAAWIATERLPEALAAWPGLALPDGSAVPPAIAARTVGADEADVALVRARLAAAGPTTAAAIAAMLALPVARVDAALAVLQREGGILSGHFDPDLDPDLDPGGRRPQWCERHLLARIHRLTVGRLRREIEPVAPRDFARFLFEWQHVGAGSRVRGPDALAAILGGLEGYEAPAASWEAELLAARVDDYAPHWFDELCTSGRIVWRRLSPAQGRPAARQADAADGPAVGAAAPGSLRTTPLVLVPRRQAARWSGIADAAVRDAETETESPSPRAQRVIDVLAARGASYFDEIADGARLLKTELEAVLADLVARGRVHGDTFAGLRALMMPAAQRARQEKRRRGIGFDGLLDAGRWTLAARPARDAGSGTNPGDGASPGNGGDRHAGTQSGHDDVEHVARTLLRRYGVVCWRLMAREPGWLPPWRDLVRVYRRLEARGEIRGGRFIAGLTGEQYALPEAVVRLRALRRQHDTPDAAPAAARDAPAAAASPAEAWVSIAATDPANLLGTVLPGPRAARVPGNRVLYRDGLPVATRIAGRIAWLVDLGRDDRRTAEGLLTRGSAPGTAGLRDPSLAS